MGGVECGGARQVVAKAAVQDGADRDAGVERHAILHSLKWKHNSVLTKRTKSCM